MKTLPFEGAGMSTKICDIGNHRIRTRFLNNDNKVIYLEINISQPPYPKRQSKKQKALNMKTKWFVSHCHEENLGEPAFRLYEGEKCGEASWKNIIQWINENLNCSYTDGEIDETLDIHDKLNDGGFGFFN
jgi:hypothetical protein